MWHLFKWLRSNVRDAILGGIADADQAVNQQVNGYSEAPPLQLPFLIPASPPVVQNLPLPALPIHKEAAGGEAPLSQPVAIPVEPTKAEQVAALRAESMSPSKIARKLKLPLEEVRDLIPN